MKGEKRDLVGPIGLNKELLDELMNDYLALDEPKEKIGRSFVSEKRRHLWGRIRETIEGSNDAFRMRIYRRAHPEAVAKQISIARVRHILLKAEVLTHYGNGKLACVLCGENRIACLSIDHIYGAGNIHRKALRRSSETFYRWLQNKDYPGGYQTLCMNDQFLKRFDNNEEAGHTSNMIDWQNA